jgi:DNA-binding CsgD family transcriptional regulator
MENVGELITYIQREDPSLEEMCQFAVIRTFNFLGAIAMFEAALDSNGNIRPVGQFGFSAEVMKSWSVSNINEEIPTADALKTNNIIWVADKDEWARDYPHLAKYEMDWTTNTFVAWPITVRGAHMSVLGLCLSGVEAPTPALISFFETVGGIMALQLSKSTRVNSSTLEDELLTKLNLFTRRQRDVIRRMADGLTNTQIGIELGFSESTIRQETMRIYEILGATGRADAVRMYRTIGARKVS